MCREELRLLELLGARAKDPSRSGEERIPGGRQGGGNWSIPLPGPDLSPPHELGRLGILLPIADGPTPGCYSRLPGLPCAVWAKPTNVSSQWTPSGSASKIGPVTVLGSRQRGPPCSPGTTVGSESFITLCFLVLNQSLASVGSRPRIISRLGMRLMHVGSPASKYFVRICDYVRMYC